MRRRVIVGRDGAWDGGLVLEKAYEIHVRGVMSHDDLAEFEHLTAVTVPAETILTGVIEDQSALHGVINRLQSLGLELVEVRPLNQSRRPLNADGLIAILDALESREVPPAVSPPGDR